MYLPVPMDAPVVKHRVVHGPDDGGGGRVGVRQGRGACARSRQPQGLQRRPRERAVDHIFLPSQLHTPHWKILAYKMASALTVQRLSLKVDER